MAKGLTENQLKFCEGYLLHGNQTRAYLNAYPGVKKYHTAGVSAHHLLKNPKISAYLKERRREIAAKLQVTPERTLRAYARKAYFDPRNLLDEDGKLKPLHQMDRATASVITEIKVKQLRPTKITNEETGEQVPVQQEILKYKFANNDNALEALSKYDGLFEKDNEQKNKAILQGLIAVLPEDLKAAIQQKVLGISAAAKGDADD